MLAEHYGDFFNTWSRLDLAVSREVFAFWGMYSAAKGIFASNINCHLLR